MQVSSGKQNRKFTRILFVTDVHGSDATFRKFVNAGRFYKADIVILSGDITGKVVVPVVRQADETYRCNLFAQEYTLRTEEELREMEQRIANVGYYSFRTTQSEIQEMITEERSDQIFEHLALERLRNWLRLAKSHLKDSGIKCMISPGNDDFYEVDSVLNSDDFAVNSDSRVIKVDELHEMITIGHSNLTPWKCPRDVTEEELARLIDGLVSKVEDIHNCIFNIHVPPVNSGIDTAPKLDDSVYPPRRVIQGGEPVYIGVGSVAVRQAIEKYQPLLGLHGHIHESRGVIKIGRTTCLNPGSEYAEGVLRGVLVNISDRKVLSHQFTSG